MTGPYARPIGRPYVVCATPQHQLERLRQQILQGFAAGLVGVGHYPATEVESAAGIFFRPAGGLKNAIQTDLFGNNELAHDLLQVRPRERTTVLTDGFKNRESGRAE